MTIGKTLLLSHQDSVAVALGDIAPGPVEVGGDSAARGLALEAREKIPAGHKIALRDLAEGEVVLKYGSPIGVATRAIPKGSWVHEHNLHSGLSESLEYGRRKSDYAWQSLERAKALLKACPSSFEGYRSADGKAGTRNELWIVPTVGCVNGTARTLADMAKSEFGLSAQALEHPYGCSQLGGDLDATKRILARLALHPNAAAVIVVSLGCENNRLPGFKAEIESLGSGGAYDPRRFSFLSLQDAGDELDSGRKAMASLAPIIEGRKRSSLPLSELCVGLKCGGSDGFSGISANPLVGRICDLVVAAGGRSVMSEVPEMFGAEADLLARCGSENSYEALAGMLNAFKHYFVAHGQVVYENPSPGNREGGITTLEEKSLGCVRKSGTAPVSAILPYGGYAENPGLSLVSGPGNDLVASTALAAAGANVILFTTGRGTPFGTVVPTLKVSSNSELARRKPSWIDFDAGTLLSGTSFDDAAVSLLKTIVATAEGSPTAAERGGHRAIAIFKDGVTL